MKFVGIIDFHRGHGEAGGVGKGVDSLGGGGEGEGGGVCVDRSCG